MKLIALFFFSCALVCVAQDRIRPQIPRTWEAEALASLEVPLATASVSPVHASPEFYYRIPVMRIYKSYPIYAPGREPAGYIDWLKQQEPVVVFNADRLRTEEDWRKAGELVFEAPVSFDGDPAAITDVNRARDPEWYKQTGTPIAREGVMPYARYVIRQKGVVEVGNLACAMCHTRVMPDGSVIKGAQGNFPFDRAIGFIVRAAAKALGEQQAADIQRLFQRFLFATPWLRPDRLARIEQMNAYEIAALQDSIPPGVLARHGTSVFSPVQIPDLIGIRERRYLDRTGLVRHRAIGDIMRYAALNQGLDDYSSYGGFVPVKLLAGKMPDPATLDTAMVGLQRARYSDEQLYALGMYLYWIRPSANPNRPGRLSERGKQVFEREGCAGCHTQPLYTNNMLTPATGFQVLPEHLKKYDILPISVETDPELAMQTRRGTGYYKVPSLKGVWYRGPFEHNGSVATLEDWFDPRRLRDDYLPTAWKGYGVKTRAVKGHEFGLKLSPEDKNALIAFLKTL